MGLCLSVTGRKKKVKVIVWKRRTKVSAAGSGPKSIGWKQKKKEAPKSSPDNYVPAEAASGYFQSMVSDNNFSKVSRTMEQSFDDEANISEQEEDNPYQRAWLSLPRRSQRNSKVSPTRACAVRKIPSFAQIQNLATSMGKSQTEFRHPAGVRPLIRSSPTSSRGAGNKSRHEISSPGPTLSSIIGNMMGDRGSNVDNVAVWMDVDNPVVWKGSASPNQAEEVDNFQPGRNFKRIVSTGSSVVSPAPSKKDQRIAMAAAAVVSVDGRRMDVDDDKLPSFNSSSNGGDFSSSTVSELSIQEVAKSYKESAAIAAARDRVVFNQSLSDNDRSLSFSSRKSDKLWSSHSSIPSQASRKFRTGSRDSSGTHRRGLSGMSTASDGPRDKGERLVKFSTISPTPSARGGRSNKPEQEQLLSQGSTAALIRASMNEPRSSSLRFMIKEVKEFEYSVDDGFESESNYPMRKGLRGTQMTSTTSVGLPWKSKSVLDGGLSADSLNAVRQPGSLESNLPDPRSATGTDLHVAEYNTFLDKLHVENDEGETTVLEDRPSISDGDMIAVLQGRPSTSVSEIYFNSVEVSSRLSSDSVCGSLYKEPSGTPIFER